LGLYLTWSASVAFTYYEHVPRIWGMSALTDQNVGGAIMMVEQSIVLVTVLAIVFSRMLAQCEQDELRRARLEERASHAAALPDARYFADQVPTVELPSAWQPPGPGGVQCRS